MDLLDGQRSSGTSSEDVDFLIESLGEVLAD
jgi:hypothetical protein